MITIREIDHLVLRVRELEPMLRFYCDTLGCTLERRRDDIGLVQLRAGRSMLDLVPVDGAIGRAGGAAPGAEGRNLDHFCLRVEPFDEPAIRRELEAKGIAVGPVVSRYGAEGAGPSIYLTDPEGNVVELKGPAELAVRAIRPGEEGILYEVFRSSVHALASRDYTPEQIAAWAPASTDAAAWARRIQSISPFVVEIGGAIAGYADVQPNGYITHFFVAGAFARRGVGSALMAHILAVAAQRGIAELRSDVSRTAQPLFERFGFVVLEQRLPVIRGVTLENALMRKDLRA